jgi:putative membrane-bound dehydrogenase-like protein
MRAALLLVALLAGPVTLRSAEPAAAPAAATPELNFESGSLSGWLAEGDAFKGQPVQGDLVQARRADMRSGHTGKYWIGTFEVEGDAPKGTLTSAPLKVTQPWASFLIGGGQHRSSRVEIINAKDGQVVYEITGENNETMQPVVVNLAPLVGHEIIVRLVDQSSNGWGHINFDDFRLHAERPKFDNERVPLANDTFSHAGLSPEEAAKAMTVPAGFHVTLFAGEPDIVQPIAQAFDDRGRLWVAEAYSYPHRVKEPDAKDRVLIFEDRDGDGHFDSRKVFMDKLNLVSGLELGFGGVWIGAAPNLLFVPDANRDDVPDGPPQVVLDGWGYQDTHETLNTFIWGPDGWLYGCHGVFTHSRVGPPEASPEQRTPINAGIWRYHPTRKQFEVFAQGTSNPWGVDFDDQGEAFCTACVIPHLFHIIPGGRYHRQAGTHFNKHTYDDIKTIADHVHWAGAGGPHAGNNRSDASGGGHAHAGALIYLGGRWPVEYRGQILMNNIHGARLNVDILEPEGSGYVGHHGKDFLQANDEWSQIVNLQSGPDGNVYLIDWYDKNQCHRIEHNIHDRTNGRIFKVSYGDDHQPPPDLTALSDRQLVELQLHPNDWHVRHARRLLQERAFGGKLDSRAVEKLTEMAFTHADVTRRLRGLWALYVTNTLGDELITRGLANDQPIVRAWSTRLAVEKPDKALAHLPRFVELAADKSPVVRKFLAAALDRLPPDSRWDVLAGLTAHAEDVTDHNLPLLYWYAAEPLVEIDPARALAWAGAATETRLLEFTARRVGTLKNGDAIELLIAQLGKLDDPVRQLAVLEGVRLSLAGRRRVDMPPSWNAVAARLATSDNPAIREHAESLAVTFGDPAALARVRGVAADRAAAVDARTAAIDTLLAVKDAELPKLLLDLLGDPPLRLAALKGLAAFDESRTPAAVLELYPQLSSAEKREALVVLCSRPAYATALLDALSDKRVPTGDVSADLVRQLRNLNDKQLAARLTEVWGVVQDTPADAAQRIAEYTKMLGKKPAQEPDVALGRAMFAKTCQQCHKLFGAGNQIGPELTGSNRANLEYLLANVLDPSALIAKDYAATVIVTTDGRVLTGIVRNDDTDAITLATADGTIVLPRDEVDQIEASTKSMMPDNILQPLSEHEVRSLVAYLASSAQTPLLATAETAKSIFNGRDLTGWTGNADLWSVDGGELVGRSRGLDRNEFLVSDLLAGDFKLTFKVKLVDDRGNSGVQFRSVALDDGEVQGYQADIGPGWWGRLYEERGRGLLWEKIATDAVRTGDWNDYEIVARGSRIRTRINGQLCVDLDDPRGMVRGVFALQLHAGEATEVRYKDLLLELDPKEEELAGGK